MNKTKNIISLEKEKQIQNTKEKAFSDIEKIKPEYLDVYDENGIFVKTQEKKEFTKEIKEYFRTTWKVRYAVKSVWLFLHNLEKELYLVQRAETEDSPWLIDKTAWGHIKSWEDYNKAIVRELQEELWLDSIVAKDENEFKELILIIDTTKVAVIKLLENIPWLLVNVKWKEEYQRRFNTFIFMGVYNWEINNFPDWSAKKCIKLSVEQALNKIENNPNNFTNILPELIKKYSTSIISNLK